jgi:hypothetical protein|tara:strand:- start:132 stop:719 length:588 start_codon:yes stop_codon:yes gene_type:complete
MTAVAAPYGLKPINLIGGQVFAGATRQIPILNGYTTSIFNGDLVKLVTSGNVEKDVGTTAATPVGIFLGCSYTDSVRGFTQSQYWPTGQVATDAVAYVCDDPDVLFKIAIVSGTTVIVGKARADLVGGNLQLVQNAGVIASGNSKVAANNTAATTATFPLRVVDVVEDSTDANGLYTEVICKFIVHQYNTALGLA